MLWIIVLHKGCVFLIVENLDAKNIAIDACAAFIKTNQDKTKQITETNLSSLNPEQLFPQRILHKIRKAVLQKQYDVLDIHATYVNI